MKVETVIESLDLTITELRKIAKRDPAKRPHLHAAVTNLRNAQLLINETVDPSNARGRLF